MAISSPEMLLPSGLAPDGRSRLILEEGRALLRLAAPIMLIALVNMGMSITDTAMVATLFGADALAAVAVGSDLYSILFYLGAGVLGGLAPFYTAATVRSDPAERARLRFSSRLSGQRPTGSACLGSILPCWMRGGDIPAPWRSH
jgi:Na+-driven multidrug efflux pump